MYSIFISYKRADKEMVKNIKDQINSEIGNKCWMDLDGIESGDQFQNVIINAIDNADIVVFMLSKNFIAPYKDEKTGKIDLKKQTFPEREVMYALRHNKRLIPISIDGTTVYDCKWLEFNCSGLDVIDWDNEDLKNKLINNLRQWTANETDEDLFLDDDDCIDNLDYEEALALYEEKQYADAFERLADLALKGNVKSQELINKIFFIISNASGTFSLSHFDETHLRMVQKLEAAGLSCGNFALHCLNYKNFCTISTFNPAKAFQYARKSATIDNNPYALLRLGICYGWGLGTKANAKLQLFYYKKAEATGLPEAYSYIGQYYEFDNGGSDSREKAIEYYKKGCNKSDQRSFNHLFRLYICDTNLTQEQKLELCQPLFDKMEQNGMYLCYEIMGDLYLGFDETDKAIKYYKKAISKDIAAAYPSLSIIQYNNSEYQKSAVTAINGILCGDSFSAYWLAFMLVNGCVEEEDKKRLFPSKLKVILGSPDFLTMKNNMQAWTLLKFDYEHRGAPSTLTYMAQQYFEGTFEECDTLEYVLQELTIFADTGDVESCNLLSKVYGGEYSRFESIADEDKHVYYLKKAADAHDPENQLKLAKYYREGSHGIIQNIVKAQDLYKQVSENINEEFSLSAIKEMNAWIETANADDQIVTEAEKDEWILKAGKKRIPEYADRALNLLESNNNIEEAFELATAMEKEDQAAAESYLLRKVNYYTMKDFSGFDIDKAKETLDSLYGKADWKNMYKYYETKRQVVPAEAILAIETKDYNDVTDEEWRILKDYYHFIPWEYEYPDTKIDEKIWEKVDDQDKQELSQAFANLLESCSNYISSTQLDEEPVSYDEINSDWLNEDYLQNLIEVRDTAIDLYMHLKSEMHPQFSLANSDEKNLDLCEVTEGSDLQLFELEMVEVRINLEIILKRIADTMGEE